MVLICDIIPVVYIHVHPLTAPLMQHPIIIARSVRGLLRIQTHQRLWWNKWANKQNVVAVATNHPSWRIKSCFTGAETVQGHLVKF